MSRNQVSTFAIREMLLWEKEMLLWDMYIYMLSQRCILMNNIIILRRIFL